MTPDAKASTIAWTYFVVAGAAEIGFTTCVKMSDGLRRIGYTLAFVGATAMSFWLLTFSLDAIPPGTAYAIRTGSGAFGTTIVGMLYLRDPVGIGRVFFILVVMAAIVGLKIWSRRVFALPVDRFRRLWLPLARRASHRGRTE